MSRQRTRHSFFWGQVAAFTLPGVLACSESSPRSNADAGPTSASGGAMGGGSAGSSSAGAGGSSGAGAAAGMGGSAGAGGAPLNVPRVETSEGVSVLDTPRAGQVSDGLCQGLAVYCNGSCLEAEAASAGNCSVLVLGLGQIDSIALGADSLYYTAGSAEILRTVLTSGTHSSVLRGITFPGALREIDGNLYFSAHAQVSFPPNYELKRVAPSGGEVTVLSQGFTATEIGLIEPVGDNLLLGVGNFDSELYLVPRAGGRAQRQGNARANSAVLDGSTLYYRQDGDLRSLSLDAPTSITNLSGTFTNSRILLESDLLYLLYRSMYMRIPVTGGVLETIQTMEVQVNDAGVREEMTLLGRTQTQALLIQSDARDPTLTQISLMPIAGGAVTPLVTLESGEYQASVATATHLYVASGESHAGAILKIALPSL
ncbi:MAG: hypothetical protein RL033_7868 [Pseudomonadota bacterium]